MTSPSPAGDVTVVSKQPAGLGIITLRCKYPPPRLRRAHALHSKRKFGQNRRTGALEMQ